jgi:hypothetical protein
MKLKFAALALAAVTALSSAMTLPAAAGSKHADCVFKRAGGGREHYRGSIGKLGVDIGVTSATELGWIVFAPGKITRGALKGSYTGAGAEATLGLGLGANVLIGGFKRGINLQPISLQAQQGLNVAAGVESLHLR